MYDKWQDIKQNSIFIYIYCIILHFAIYLTIYRVQECKTTIIRLISSREIK
jgi:hypothetical protein